MMLGVQVVLALCVAGPGGQSWRPPELKVKAPPAEIDFDVLQNLALQYLGRPYVTGGVGNPGFDCSGFVCRVYAEAGYGLPRVSRDQARAGRKVDLKKVQPGDLLFFAERGALVSHVGLYLGEGHMIHASSGRGEVVVASLNATWFKTRLVGARRVLTSTTGAAGSVFVPAEVRELVEHEGRFSLPPMKRRPSRRAPLSYGPELMGEGISSIGFRTGFLTEAGVLGAVMVPQATLHVERWAFEVTAAVPVRFEVNKEVTLGRLERWQDYARFLRTLRLGLPGADLELRLSRLGEASLGTGFIVDRVSPGTGVPAIPGLTVLNSALSLYGAYRFEGLEVETFVDDVLGPGLLGGAVVLPVGGLKFGAAVASDQQARLQGSRRAFTSGETFLSYAVLADHTSSLDLRLTSAALRGLGKSGAGGALSVHGQWRPKGSVTVSGSLEGAVLGPRFLAGFFGPTYLAHRDAHSAALGALATRGALGARFELAAGGVSLGAGYGQGLGVQRHALDRRLEGYIAVRGLALSRSRRLDLRLVFLSRAPFDRAQRLYTAHGGARLTLMPWLAAELYLQKSETWEGGGGLTVRWAP